jgi:hypothetical protein
MSREMKSSAMMDDVDLRAVSIVSVAEGRATVETFIEDDSDTPPVTPTIIGMSEQNFRCHVLSSAHNTARETSSLRAVAVGQQTFIRNTSKGLLA